jgi:hypothetical protein
LYEGKLLESHTAVQCNENNHEVLVNRQNHTSNNDRDQVQIRYHSSVHKVGGVVAGVMIFVRKLRHIPWLATLIQPSSLSCSTGHP